MAGLLMGFAPLAAQDTLRLEDAIAEALNANYSVQVQRYDERRSENSAYAGGAGLLPSLSIGGNGQYNNQSAIADVLRQDPNTGETRPQRVEQSGIQTGSAGAQAQLSYTLALANFRNYRVLQGNATLSQEQTQQVIENTSVQVITAYYNLAKLANRLGIQRQALARSRERLSQVQNQQEFGGADRLAVLNAKVNVNTDSINLVSTTLNYQNARRDLNLLMGRDIDSQYAVNSRVSPSKSLELEGLRQAALANNASLEIAEQNRQLAELNLQVAQAGRYPTLSLQGSYGYDYSNNGPFSFAPEVQSWGPSVSASLNFPLFDGFQITRRIQNAEIDVASSRTRYREAEQMALRDLAKTYAEYQNNRDVLALNQMSLEAAQLNFERTREAFELGQATGVEFREAQTNLEQVENQLNDLRFDIKLNEVELLQLSGQLVSGQEGVGSLRR